MCLSIFDIFEAYTILNDNKLLDHHFNFSEKLVDNLHLYSSEVQLKMCTELEELQTKTASENQSKFALFQAHIYIFAIGVFPTGEIAVLETHAIAVLETHPWQWLWDYHKITSVTNNVAMGSKETASQWCWRYLHSVLC